MDKNNLEYICAHYGEEEKLFNAVTPPLFMNSLFVFDKVEDHLNYDAANKNSFMYTRMSNPTVELVEKKLAAIEGAESCACFASGMAAISTAILHFLKTGDHIITVKNVYGPTRTFIEENLVNLGMSHDFVNGNSTDELLAAIKPNTRVLYLESPTSLVMEIQDLKRIAEIAKQKGIATIIDNTWAASVYQKPLEVGIDLSIQTMSKYYGGHSDVVGGCICGSNELISVIKTKGRELFGGILGNFEAWQVLRSLRTFPLRLEKSSKNAQAVAEYLETRKEVIRLNYPGVKSFPQYELAKTQLTGSSGLMSFELDASLEKTVAFVNELKMFQKGVSWGGFESLAIMPCYKLTDEVAKDRNSSRNLIRIYCGLENSDDLIEDLKQAFEVLKK